MAYIAVESFPTLITPPLLYALVPPIAYKPADELFNVIVPLFSASIPAVNPGSTGSV